MNTLFVFGAKYVWLISVIVVTIYFLMQDRATQKKMIVFGGLSIVLVCVFILIAGWSYYNPRPFVVGNFTPLIPHAADNGFPSDHTLLTATIAAFLTYYNRRIAILLWCIAVIVGVSRVYVGVHHPIDIIGSIVISIIGTGIIYLLLKKFSHKKSIAVS